MNVSTFMEDSFLQSSQWEEIQNCYGRKTTRLSSGGRDILWVRNDLRFGMNYWYSPRPYVSDLNQFLEAALPLAKEGLFFRVEPLNELRIKNQESRITVTDSPPKADSCPSGRRAPLAERFMIQETKNLQPRETILIDLLKDENELYAVMHPKTRYNIRVAERRGVTVEARAGDEAADEFYELLAKTARRDNFSLHPKKYYECLLLANSRELENKIFFAKRHDRIAAAALVNFYKGTATYLHGASDYTLRHIMAPYALHWEIIKEARRRGLRVYDFGGINQARWPCLTRFKAGFGGKGREFPRAFDIVTSQPKYLLYRGCSFLAKFPKFRSGF